jgi:hypothetical protein
MRGEIKGKCPQGVGMFYVVLITASANDDIWQVHPHSERQQRYRTRDALIEDFRSNTGIVPIQLREDDAVPPGGVIALFPRF